MAQRRILALSLLLASALVGPAAAQTDTQTQTPEQAPPARASTPAPVESRIKVMTATLGQKVGKTCDAAAAVARLCDGKSRCRVTAADTLCAAPLDPNPLIATLQVGYRCNPKEIPQTVSADRPLDVTLVCRRKIPPP